MIMKRCTTGLLVATLVLGWWLTQRTQPVSADGGGTSEPRPQSQQSNVFDDMVAQLPNPDPNMLIMPRHNSDPKMIITPIWPRQHDEASIETKEQ